MNKEQKTYHVIDWLASLARQAKGKDIQLNYNEVPCVEADEARSIVLALSKMYPLLLTSEASFLPEYSLNFVSTIINPEARNILIIKSLFNTMETPVQKKNRTPHESSSINKIEVVTSKESENTFKIIVNGDYKKIIDVNKTKKIWGLLYLIATKQQARTEGNKSSLDTLNTNRRCKLYTATSFKPTKILCGNGSGMIVPKDGIEIKAITEKAFNQRRNKLQKNA